VHRYSQTSRAAVLLQVDQLEYMHSLPKYHLERVAVVPVQALAHSRLARHHCLTSAQHQPLLRQYLGHTHYENNLRVTQQQSELQGVVRSDIRAVGNYPDQQVIEPTVVLLPGEQHLDRVVQPAAAQHGGGGHHDHDQTPDLKGGVQQYQCIDREVWLGCDQT